MPETDREERMTSIYQFLLNLADAKEFEGKVVTFD